MLEYTIVGIACGICAIIGYITGILQLKKDSPVELTETDPELRCVVTKGKVPPGIDEESFNQFVKTCIVSTSREAVDRFLSKDSDFFKLRKEIISSLSSSYLEMWRGIITFDRFDPDRPVFVLVCRKSHITPEGFTMDFMWSKEG